MKVIVTTQGKDLKAQVDPRFGRAKWLLNYDLDADTFEVVENRVNLEAAQGAGIQTATLVKKLGAAAVLTGNCGPKAFKVLQAAGIQVFTALSGEVQQVIDLYRSGKLAATKEANVEGHWV